MNATPPDRPAPCGVRGPGGETLRYAGVSLVALVVDVATLAALVASRANPALAAVVGYAAGLGAHYLLAVRYVFRYRSLSDRPHAEAGVYALTGVVGTALSGAIVAAGDAAGLSVAVSKGVAVIVVFWVVYAIRRRLLFEPPRP